MADASTPNALTVAGLVIQAPETIFTWISLQFSLGLEFAALALHLEKEWPGQLRLMQRLAPEGTYFPLTIQNLANMEGVELSYGPHEGDVKIRNGDGNTSYFGSHEHTRMLSMNQRSVRIITGHLQTRGRLRSALAPLQSIPLDIFNTPFTEDRKSNILLIGDEKIYDVRIRVNPALAPDRLALVADFHLSGTELETNRKSANAASWLRSGGRQKAEASLRAKGIPLSQNKLWEEASALFNSAFPDHPVTAGAMKKAASRARKGTRTSE